MASVLADFWTAAWHEGMGVSGGPFSWLQATACENNPRLLPPGIPAPWETEVRVLLELLQTLLSLSPPQLPGHKYDENVAFLLEKQLCCVLFTVGSNTCI